MLKSTAPQYSDKVSTLHMINFKGVAYFESKEKKESFHAVKAPIHKVSHEQVVRGGAVPSHMKQLLHVEELSMNIPAYTS